jgi:type I restriction enzyme S subunit
VSAPSKLPDGWAPASLAQIGGIVGGKTPSKAEPAFWHPGAIPWVSPKDMKRFVLDGSADLISEIALTKGGMNLLPQGSVLMVTRSGILAHTFPVALAAVPLSINQDIKAAPPIPEVNPRYLAYQMKSLGPAILKGCAKDGTTVASVDSDMLSAFPIAVAPEAEQRRIADKLDTVLARVDSVNDRLARVAPLLKRFRQSVLSAATSGKLTEEWRRLHQQPPVADVALQRICQASRVITYGVVKLGDEVAGGTPCLRTSNVRWLRFELDGMKSIRPSLSAEYGRTILQGGEVLVNVRGTLGGVAVAAPEMKGWNVSREVAVVPVDSHKADPRFVALCIGGEEGQRWLTGVAKGVAYTGINIEDLRTLPLKLPTLLEQAEIVRRVELLFSYAARLEARLQAAQASSERLTPALLAKAFRGELVPQDPDDEPASELLKRLAVQRAQAGSTSARPRGRKPAALSS